MPCVHVRDHAPRWDEDADDDPMIQPRRKPTRKATVLSDQDDDDTDGGGGGDGGTSMRYGFARFHKPQARTCA